MSRSLRVVLVLVFLSGSNPPPPTPVNLSPWEPRAKQESKKVTPLTFDTDG